MIIDHNSGTPTAGIFAAATTVVIDFVHGVVPTLGTIIISVIVGVITGQCHRWLNKKIFK